MPETRLSVIITIVDGGATLERCLAALAAQREAPPLDVIVPWDDSVPGIPALAARFPDMRFLALGPLTPAHPVASPSGQHELFDRRRSAGLLRAEGDLVAILEDRGVPDPDWAATFVRLHAELPHAAIGGAVDNARDGVLNWSVFYCDFGRYQPPYAAGPRDYVTDVNICYKRGALEATRELWRERYHETTVHWALQRNGETLYLTAIPVVRQMREGLGLGSLLRERAGWGRLFAYTRARDVGARRFAFAAIAPLLPPLLYLRLVRGRLARGHGLGRVLALSPVLLLLLAAWSVGELQGYLTGRP